MRCRLAAEPEVRAARVEREARVLEAVAGISPLPVPEPRFAAAEAGCLAYLKLPGLPLLDLPAEQRSAHATSIAAELGELLAALHAVPVERMAALVEPDDASLTEWRDEARESYETVAAAVPEASRPLVEAFLDGPPPEGEHAPAFTHNDLGIEHVLVDKATWTVSGIIDWGDAAIADPAYDLGLLCRDLGPAALDAAIRAHGEVELEERAVFYARCSVFEDLAYGIETGRDAYVDKCLAALAWLFPQLP